MFLKEYIITLKDINLLMKFYEDMENENNIIFIPSRAVTCIKRRPLSRNTHYLITNDEAKQLKNDPRIEYIIAKNNKHIIKSELHSLQTGTWSRSSTSSIGNKNWGLYRCQLEDNILSWGSETANKEQTSTINFTSSGKNVDIIIVDDNVYPSHNEFSSRFINYDWFNLHDIAVKGNATVITNISRTSNIATITTQDPHGLTTSNIVNVNCTSDNSFNASSVSITVTSDFTFNYSNNGTNVITTIATGNWTGSYQSLSYDSINNHATAVAGIIAGNTQGWARDSNLYNINHTTTNKNPAEYIDFLYYIFDYIKEFHNNKPINPLTGKKNPTLVNNSWGLTVNTSSQYNAETGHFNNIARINYRGTIINSSNTAIDTGISGIFTSTALISNLSSVVSNSGNRIVTTTVDSGTVSTITFEENGRTGLIEDTTPTSSNPAGYDSNDDAFWTISLPFNITYCTQSYNTIYIGSNSYITFGLGSSTSEVGIGSPTTRKILISAGDRYCKSIWYGEFGSDPNKIFIIRWEGFEGAFSTAHETEPNFIWEIKFYQNNPTQIDLHIVSNPLWRGEFSISELETYGIMFNETSLPVRNSTLDADIADAINSGIIFVGSAGNNAMKVDKVGGLDYDNYYVYNGDRFYYNRGTSPGSSHPNVICVGSIDSISQETKSAKSNTGPGVDIYSPGVNIATAIHDTNNIIGTSFGELSLSIESGGAGVSSITLQAGKAYVTVTNHNLTSGQVITIEDCINPLYNVQNAIISVYDLNNIIFDISSTVYDRAFEPLSGTIKVGYLYEKYSGTSMASAQISGLLALALEKYPMMTQSQAKEYILQKSKKEKITDTNGSYNDPTSLQGGNNKLGYYHKERSDQGFIFPQNLEFLRPVTGFVFPRKKIKK